MSAGSRYPPKSFESFQALLMSENRLGLVSNCWKVQLDAGESLSSLIQQAEDAGFRFVELRQGCLGECENPETRLPDTNALASLAVRFPVVTFNLAVELPIFSRSVSAASSNVRTILDAALALADGHAERGRDAVERLPHLRIVDPVSRTVPPAREDTGDDDNQGTGFQLEDVITSLRELQSELTGGVLSVEHSYQPWNGFRRLFEMAGSGEFECAGSSSTTSPLRLCYDPCNLWLADDGHSACEITSAIPVDWLSMVHLKQWCDGRISTKLEAGEVDWSEQLRTLEQAGYAGPFLFETAPTEDVWQCLADSQQYLAAGALKTDCFHGGQALPDEIVD